MDATLKPGRYVVAVSGGVDSMVLLDILRRIPDIQLIVAHYDHGIRYDSSQDRRLVQSIAKQYGLTFLYDEGNLGPDASEAVARKARYEFLHKVRNASRANGIITAHHQDDLLETAILNLLRGTGRRGLSSLKSTDIMKRPLLHVPKHRLINYAQGNNLIWHEDSTNSDTRYTRNYIRHVLLPKFSPNDREKLLQHINRMHELNAEIDHHLTNHLHVQPAVHMHERRSFIALPHKVAAEVLAAWLRKHGVRDFDRKTIERLIVAAKTFKPGQAADVDKRYLLRIGKDDLALIRKDR
ncbi:MAG: hypothetical protein JWL85_644 [Candidatus Saccharibacteria bacterium]|nr:hypothetical protein [Candidatus Saccharibacteria bacterium]